MRRVAFAALLAAMVATLVWLAVARGRPDPTARHEVVATSIAPTGPSRPAPLPGALSSVRGFVLAFLSREVGTGGGASVAAIRADASAEFAHQLLAPAMSPTTGDPRRARLASLRIEPIAGHPRLILVSGLARRPSGPEPLSFLFAERDGRWLAIAPGE